MKKLIFFLLAIIPILSFSQKLSIEMNTRSAKIDTVFDWYAGIGLTDSIRKFAKYELYYSTERDQGTMYHAYKASIHNKHFKLSRIADMEKDIVISSVSVFHSIKIKDATVRLGFDGSYANDFIGGGYIGFKYKFISAETAFNSNSFYKLTYKIEPKVKLNKNLSVSLFVHGMLIEDKYKWRNGLKFSIEL